MTVAATRFIPAPDQGSAEVVVLAAELFPEVVVIIIATTIWDEVAEEGFFDREHPALTLEDDVGTEYRRTLQVGAHTVGDKKAWSGSRGVTRLKPSFAPPVPAEATHLRANLGRWGTVVLTV